MGLGEHKLGVHTVDHPLFPSLSLSQYLQATGNNWRWFDDRSGRWCSYSASNNSTIDAAWRAGETSVRFTAGRRRYTVQFTTMVQVPVSPQRGVGGTHAI